jgi:hypothetical protein
MKLNLDKEDSSCSKFESNIKKIQEIVSCFTFYDVIQTGVKKMPEKQLKKIQLIHYKWN